MPSEDNQESGFERLQPLVPDPNGHRGFPPEAAAGRRDLRAKIQGGHTPVTTPPEFTNGVCGFSSVCNLDQKPPVTGHMKSQSAQDLSVRPPPPPPPRRPSTEHVSRQNSGSDTQFSNQNHDSAPPPALVPHLSAPVLAQSSQHWDTPADEDTASLGTPCAPAVNSFQQTNVLPSSCLPEDTSPTYYGDMFGNSVSQPPLSAFSHGALPSTEGSSRITTDAPQVQSSSPQSNAAVEHLAAAIQHQLGLDSSAAHSHALMLLLQQRQSMIDQAAMPALDPSVLLSSLQGQFASLGAQLPAAAMVDQHKTRALLELLGGQQPGRMDPNPPQQVFSAVHQPEPGSSEGFHEACSGSLLQNQGSISACMPMPWASTAASLGQGAAQVQSQVPESQPQAMEVPCGRAPSRPGSPCHVSYAEGHAYSNMHFMHAPTTSCIGYEAMPQPPVCLSQHHFAQQGPFPVDMQPPQVPMGLMGPGAAAMIGHAAEHLSHQQVPPPPSQIHMGGQHSANQFQQQPQQQQQQQQQQHFQGIALGSMGEAPVAPSYDSQGVFQPAMASWSYGDLQHMQSQHPAILHSQQAIGGHQQAPSVVAAPPHPSAAAPPPLAAVPVAPVQRPRTPVEPSPEVDLQQYVPVSQAEKLKKEISRLQSEVERLEKEVTRQKGLRESERTEFMDAKERLKASWAADREDFARVKEGLKKKNAEHHIQSGKLSQAVREAESVARGLRELCAREGVPIPSYLDGPGHGPGGRGDRHHDRAREGTAASAMADRQTETSDLPPDPREDPSEHADRARPVAGKPEKVPGAGNSSEVPAEAAAQRMQEAAVPAASGFSTPGADSKPGRPTDSACLASPNDALPTDTAEAAAGAAAIAEQLATALGQLSAVLSSSSHSGPEQQTEEQKPSGRGDQDCHRALSAEMPQAMSAAAASVEGVDPNLVMSAMTQAFVQLATSIAHPQTGQAALPAPGGNGPQSSCGMPVADPGLANAWGHDGGKSPEHTDELILWRGTLNEAGNS
uniref:Uncharacterized protein n=1 Tax=Tetraselmis sp. GSL018 TaxID=582737 RepID=A0A061RRF8_9CHLO|eukprot:CAMPEP_0177623626 /NCGR_PEP_ID=MMETSP0419_2-20121207/29003_1 /TAXON_ID=582737 /ORGANISM="Tetraselmis sp., Strain GSL018" /LENGTH=1009 /DNA_ID=CAMNT_0019124191 /DNA_START=271 /DNA_END=3300 /DNA_ORIENTATION=-